jgi:hypothetical protein
MLKEDEEESEKWRQEFLKKYKDFLDLNNRLFQLANDMVNTNKITSNTTLHDCMAFLFAKSHKTFWAIDILAQRGFGQDAAILTRSLFELLVTTKYLTKEEKSVDRYSHYDCILRKRLIDKYKEDIKNGKISLSAEVQALLNDKEKMAEVEKSYQIAEPYFKENRRKDAWSGKTIKEMAEEVGLYHEYNYFYWLLSHQVHSNSMSMRDYINFSGGEIECESGPSERFVKEVLRYSFLFFLDVLEVVNQTFQLGFKDQISESAHAYNLVFQKW